MHKRLWLRQSKIQEYYLDADERFDNNVRTRDYQLYWAVIDGSIRAKHKGKILNSEELHSLSEKKWAENDDYALPFDLEISVEDVQKLWQPMKDKNFDSSIVRSSKYIGIWEAIDILTASFKEGVNPALHVCNFLQREAANGKLKVYGHKKYSAKIELIPTEQWLMLGIDPIGLPGKNENYSEAVANPTSILAHDYENNVWHNLSF